MSMFRTQKSTIFLIATVEVKPVGKLFPTQNATNSHKTSTKVERIKTFHIYKHMYFMVYSCEATKTFAIK